MFRAILRLTKKSDQNPESESGQEVEFVDMLKEQEKETPDVYVFISKSYNGLLQL